MMRFLSQKDLKQLLRMEEVIEAVENAFREYGEGKYRMPVRFSLEIPELEGTLLLMPAFLGGSEVMGSKLVSVYPQNPQKGLPSVMALYILNDAKTGRPLAVMDGTYLTGIRTGAASAIASKYLARKSSTVLGIFGAGVQAEFQLWALKTSFPLKKVLVYSRTLARAEMFAKEMSRKYQIPVEAMSRPEEVVKDSDILVTATTSKVPVFQGREVTPGTHINAIGAFTPQAREVDEDLVQAAKIVVDTYEGTQTEAGDLLIPIQMGLITLEDIYAELSELVMGQKAGRTNDQEITLFKSVGVAIEDAATAKLAYDRAVQLGVGTILYNET
ncbi:MAG TPA: ornithine cyclodeaminase family protein [Candidatus Limnocylindrales bacterium]|nr:ornithine cyclodeaminase family protein [Candidatus Limnocylindrales bacterium]